MFDETFLEVFVFLLYWGHFIPYAYDYASDNTRKWVDFQFGNMEDTYFPLLVFVLIGGIAYLTVNRCVMDLYRQILEFDKDTLRKVKIKLKKRVDEIDIEKQRLFADEADGKSYRKKKDTILK